MKHRMKRLGKQIISAVCALSMVFGSMISDLGTVKVQAAGEHTVWVVGDSTVCAYPGKEESYYYKRCGYGAQIKAYLTDNTYEVENLAVSGTSSKSFAATNANYTTLKNGIRAGDILVVGFGHNDAKDEADRYTNPNNDYKTDGSFAKSLYDNYVKLAADNGAEVILCTPIVRRSTNGSWGDGNLHVKADKTGFPGGSYPAAIRTLVDDLTTDNLAGNVTLVDLTTLTQQLYTSSGVDNTLYFHAWLGKEASQVDNTHLNTYGAKLVAGLFAEAVSASGSSLAGHISKSQCTPDKDTDVQQNPDWKAPASETGDLAQSTLFDDYVIKADGKEDVVFKGTAFGTLNADPKTSEARPNHVLETDQATGDMHIAVKNNAGKFASTNDAFDMYYYRVPADKNFKLTARALLNAFNADQQVGFGLVAHDRVHIDTNETYTADFVVAGSLGTGTNCFKRKNGTLEKGKSLSTPLQAGNTYELSLEWQDEGFTCKFGDEPAQSAGFDYALTKIDKDYVYIGMFCTRNADVTFSNIVLTVNGVELANTTKDEYAVTVATGEHGTGVADKTTASKGHTVTLTAKPAAGYVLDHWDVVSGGEAVKVEDNIRFAMPEGAVTATPVFVAMPKEWKFNGGSGDSVTIQGKKEIWQGLEIDATNRTNDAKFYWDGSAWAQFNIGTIIKIPFAEKCKVTVTSFSKDTITVNGNDVKGSEITVGCIPTGENDYITIVSRQSTTGDSNTKYYIGSIKVEKDDNIEEHTINASVKEGQDAMGTVSVSPAKATLGTLVTLNPVPASGNILKGWEVTQSSVVISDNCFYMPDEDVSVKAVFEEKRTEWDFKNDATLEAVTIQNEIKNYAGLKIDATASGAKWYAASKAAVQTNLGTKIYVPVEVPEGGKVKVTIQVDLSDSSTDTLGYLVEGQEFTEDPGQKQSFICSGKDSWVVLEPTEAKNYLSYIKVEPIVYTAEGNYDLTQKKFPENLRGVDWGNYKYVGVDGQDMHGPQGSGAIKINLPQKQKADIIIETCGFGASSNVTATYKGEGLTKTVVNTGHGDGCSFTITGAEGEVEVTLSASNAIWIHSLSVEYVYEPGDRKIDVWDFAGLAEKDTATYNNNITPEIWLEKDILFKFDASTDATKKGFKSTGEIVFGDLTIRNADSDRLFSEVTETSGKFAELLGANAKTYRSPTKDSGYGNYAPKGGFYGNGPGSNSSKDILIAHVQAGDKIVAYMGLHQVVTPGAGIEFTFEGTGAAAGQKETVSITDSEMFKKCEFVAQKKGTYHIYQSGSNNKVFYHRIVRVPAVQVSGKITFPAAFTATDYSLKFVNQGSKAETMATVKADGSYVAMLAPGYTYTAVLSGATGWGMTGATKTVTTTEAEALTGIKHDLDVEAKTTYAFTGTIKGFAAGYKLDDLVIEMVPTEAGSASDPVALAINKSDMSFSVTLDPDVNYAVRLSGGVSDYQVKSPAEISNNEPYQEDIVVELKPTYAMTGAFLGLDGNASAAQVTALSFVLTETEGTGQFAKTYTYEYPATLSAGGYSVNLREGAYEAQATAAGYRTASHVVVGQKKGTKNLLFVSTAEKAKIEKKSDIYVGYPKKADNYDTVTEAVEACSLMTRSGESDRVTIHIAPGTYREQIIINTPYITLVNDEPGKEVLLTWYYGIGYQYYSSKGGFYNAESAFDQYTKAKVDKWGTAVYVKKDATAFRAEGITFENSFNRYITDEEIEDGAEPGGGYNDTNISIVRENGLDVTTRAATERAAAICIEAPQSEFYNCKFYSSQDTLYTQADMYFKNCVIEGMTDYIYGSGNCVFDACELSWKGYRESTQGGYITAAKTGASEEGYLFRNCVVTANKKNAEGKDMLVGAGYFGRCWGGADTKTLFLNTRLESADLIKAEGWGAMSNTQPENVPGNKEFNTTDLGGKAVSTTGRKGHVITEADAAEATIAKYFGSWTPAYYTPEDATVAFATAPYVTDNGDINIPKPGHTLTVNYSLGQANDANDASMIQWYRVAADNTETLVKTSAAQVDKTYKIAKEDTGSYIKAVVTPITVSGKKGEAQSDTVSELVGEGYDDPNGGADIELGDGINIFLAGDSTVKDYSADGMYNGGKILAEGAWGEFLQAYFDPAKVKIQNYANGGRSTRNFINEGSLDKIKNAIGEGDYLFIQFGHNDSSNAIRSHVNDRYAPLGTADAQGIYPVTAGTPDASGKYSWDCGGTYKWYLLQYINVAREKGAIPVLVTPVARMYYNSDGTIRAHHDEDIIGLTAEDAASDETLAAAKTAKGNKNKNNSYVEAVRQLAEQENVLLLDAFDITEKLFIEAYNAAKTDGVVPNDTYGRQIMSYDSANNKNDSTHNNKVGGMMEAAVIASALQGMDLNISKAVKAPQNMSVKTPEGKTAFSVSNAGKLKAYDILQDYEEPAEYWTTKGQAMIDAIAGKGSGNESGGNGEGGSGNEGGEGGGNGESGSGNEGGEGGNQGGNEGGEGGNQGGNEGGEGGNQGGNEGGEGGNQPNDTNEGKDKPAKTGLQVAFKGDNKIFTYTGSAIKPELIVTNNGTVLIEGVDYTVAYSNNVNAADEQSEKKPTVTVTGKGNFSGKYAETFVIERKSLCDADNAKASNAADIQKIVRDDAVYVLNNKKADPVLLYAGVKLGAKDYEISDASHQYQSGETGTVKLTAKEGGNFKDSVELDVVVLDKFEKFNVSMTSTSATYNAQDQKSVIGGENLLVTPKSGTETVTYEVSYSADTVNAGTVKVTVLGKGKYTGTVTKTFKITPLKADVSKMTVDGAASEYEFRSEGVTFGDKLSVSYTGLPQTDHLVQGRDYKVTYSNNKKVGDKAKYTITFLGNYKGTAKMTDSFKINPMELKADSSIVITIPDKVYNRPNQYKSVPIVTVNGVALKAAEYKVEYYLSSGCETESEMNKNNKITLPLENGENYQNVYVKIIGKGKNCKGEITYASNPGAMYTVRAKGEGDYDLSKARVTFYEDEAKQKKITKVGYSGEAVKPAYVKVECKPGGKGAFEPVPESMYTVTYCNNVLKGKATAVITGTGVANTDGKAAVGSKNAAYTIISKDVKTTANKAVANAAGVANEIRLIMEGCAAQ